MTDSVSIGEIILFLSEDGQTKIQVRIEGQTVWLPQRLIFTRNANSPLRQLFGNSEQFKPKENAGFGGRQVLFAGREILDRRSNLSREKLVETLVSQAMNDGGFMKRLQ